MHSTANNNDKYKWAQLETTLRDHCELNSKVSHRVDNRKEVAGKAFKVNEKFDETVRKGFTRVKLEQTKKAGIIANQKASIATGWILSHVATDFKDASMAWTGTNATRNKTHTQQLSKTLGVSQTQMAGVFFVAGEAFQHKETKQVALSLGFREWGALGALLSPTAEAGGEDRREHRTGTRKLPLASQPETPTLIPYV